MNVSQKFPLWKLASLYLLLLAGFFFGSYGVANQHAASLFWVPSISYSWEKHIPFWPWTIIPYWSMDLFYGLSFFICTSKKELTVHAKRLFLASLICCTCFILFPLACKSVIPAVSNPLLRWLIGGSGLVATPFNQAPSLHIALAWLVWLRFRAHTHGVVRVLLTVWFILIGLSVLTCYQHHFIDVPLGFFVGVLISYLLPMSSFARILPPWTCQRAKLALFYLLGSFLLAGLAWYEKGVFLWLFWPALSLLIVGFGYILWGTAIFQKDMHGKLSLSARILLAPYRFGAFISKCYFTRSMPSSVKITDKIYLGSLPIRKRLEQNGLLDMTAEFDSSTIQYAEKVCCPRMDLLAQTPEQIQKAVEKLIDFSQKGSVLVCCALGLSRSATIVIAYLVFTKQYANVRQATQFVQQKRPQIVLSAKQEYYLHQWQRNYTI